MAEGAIIWKANSNSDLANANFVAIHRIGNLTDQSIAAESQATHQQLLREVTAAGQPVVVPATPGACDPAAGANPLSVPAAIVAIETDTKTSHLIEVFLEPDCGIATQRGYLRFVAQMADLAAEFLRGNQLRELNRAAELNQRIDSAIHDIGTRHGLRRIEAAIVDRAAELFGFDRTALCVLSGKKARIAAVSHVDAVDKRSVAAEQIRHAAAHHRNLPSAELTNDDPHEIASQADELQAGEPGTDNAQQIANKASDDTHPALRVAFVAAADQVPLRLVCLSDPGRPIDQQQLGAVERFLDQTSTIWKMAAQLESIPGGKLLAALGPGIDSKRQGRRRFFLGAAMVAAMCIAAIVPVPLIVTSGATLRPENVQSVYSPRQVVVDAIHVSHGQEVSKGTLLVSLADPDLNEQIIALLGRRGVLVQQQSRWTEELTASNSRLDKTVQLRGEQSLVAEEIRSIDQQLALLKEIQDSLEIRAEQSGIVNAWQIEQRLLGRPLERGDFLLQVIDTDAEWLVDAQVAQSRISHVSDAHSSQDLSVNVVLDANSEHAMTAELLDIGPSMFDAQTATNANSVLLKLTPNDGSKIWNEAATNGQSLDAPLGPQSGAPATVSFHCGSAPLGFVLFQDLLRVMKTTTTMYFTSMDSQ